MTTIGMLEVITVFLFLGAVPAPVLGRSAFIVASPKRAKYDTPTTFSVSASGITRLQTIHLLLRTGNASEIILNQTTLSFREDGVQTWNVVIDSSRLTRHLQNTIQLRTEFGTKVEVTEIPMDNLSGYIMIQTDKVIYTPRQTVMYRVIALDDDQRFSKWNITVDIKNPDLIILERHHHTSAEAFIGKNFSLPRDATPGTWSITATFRGSKVVTTKTVKFDVEEYVLPTYKVEVRCEENVIALGINWIQVRVKAVYSYGEPVQGRVHVRLGAVKDDRVVLFDVLYTGRLNRAGQLNVSVPVRDLRNHSLWYPEGHHMYLEANVTEDGTGQVETAVYLNSIFANPFYIIDFSESKQYFRPGFNYTMVVSVKAANGDEASNIMTHINMDIKDENNNFVPGASFGGLFDLDEHGRMNETVFVPDITHAIKIRVFTLDLRAPSRSVNTLTVKKYQSESNTYIHLAQEGNGIRIRYTPSLDVSQQQITVLITSRGRLVYSTSVPRDSVGSALLPLSRSLLVATSPVARVVAYFYMGSTREVVADGLFIDTEDVCRDELSLDHDSHIHGNQLSLLPKETSPLYIYGGSSMRVGLLAVDKAVYFLKDERSLTREKIFAMLDESHEGRNKMGDIGNTEKIFQFAGLQYKKVSEETALPDMVRSSYFDVGRLNFIVNNARRGNDFLFEEPMDREESIPLEKVRRYFPESWFFKEFTLTEDGDEEAMMTMPDSITTWSFTAVGVGPEGGVCMSRPLDIRVFKPFFGDVRLPYKAVRLEEVTVNINIYNYFNYNISVTVSVIGGPGVCFSEGFGGQRLIQYRTTLRTGQTNGESVRMIPLVAGKVKLTVDIRSTNGLNRDIVEKTLHVVAEGRKVQKSITFPLDPSGRHSHAPANRRGVRRTNTASVTNRIMMHSNTQLTSIDLYMPEEVIHGSEKCQISACGDLMGDIINTAVLEGDNLFESSVVDAEEAIGNLAPTVHALLYLNQSHFMTPFVNSKGRTHVKYGVVRLLMYRKKTGSFSLTPDSPPATWLTALVLKTLCYAEQITFIDKDALIRAGFSWLLDQTRDNGTLNEQDRRLARPSVDYDIMLSAETMIALLECGTSRPLRDDDWVLLGNLEALLAEHIHIINSPLVMAKVAYALTLSEPSAEDTVQAVNRLHGMMRTTPEGLNYWSVTSENEPPRRPFWYHSGTKASSIEATAYALLVFLRQTTASRDYSDDFGELPWRVNLDAIAGWLIQKRNSHGAFIGAMDTAAATQAISEYSLSNLVPEEVNLHCNVTTRPTRNYTHSFDFNEDNAIMPKSLSNVPVGRQLHVETQGTGLGQMQVRVEYNVPVDTNADCHYNISITHHLIRLTSRRRNVSDLCHYCNMGCDEDNAGGSSSGRYARQKRQATANRVSICLQVCIRSTDDTYADRSILTINMLSGFEPYLEDLEQIYERRDSLYLSSLVWLDEKAAVEMKFNQVPNDRSTCVSFRAIERQDVARRNPAMVTVRAHEDQEPTCVESYDPVVSEVNLAVYCANNQSSNLGQCRCFSGNCGMCYTRSSEVALSDIQDLVCSSEYIYKIQRTSESTADGWVDMIANVISTEKNSEEEVGPRIHMVTPQTCRCPYSAGLDSHHYFFGSHVDTFVNRNNGRSKTHLLDQTTTFISPNLGTNDQDRTGNWIRVAMSGRCRN